MKNTGSLPRLPWQAVWPRRWLRPRALRARRRGMQAASVPPPGFYYLGYLLNYDIDDFRAPGTKSNLPGHNRGTVSALPTASSGSRSTSCWAPTTAWRPSCP
ncbi:hypothetical protein [Ottowia beijingensis]|uniref:hypothetical protein n=1 Tax=Ottowia beijingensis TaxID=1207057 RepID=UPI00214D1C27|nr:hypothetical protein [Ottowia beijingensis]